MAISPIYLDHAATTPVRDEVIDTLTSHLRSTTGNPSSLHGAGQRARTVVDEARDRLAEVIGGSPGEIVFTSGGTEADNLAVRGVLDRWGSQRGRHLVVSAIEHDAVLATAHALSQQRRAEVTVVPCDPTGVVSAAALAAAVRPDTVLVSLMLVNNEIGTVQDVAAAAAAVHARNPATLVHTDAVQALGRIEIAVDALGVDLLSLSGHKFSGPKGAGALWVRRGVGLTPQASGGGHERGRRAGTENVPAIAGLGLAALLAEQDRPALAVRLDQLCARLETAVLNALPGARVAGAAARRAPGFSTLLIPGVHTEVLLTALDAVGVCVSGGSACSSGATIPSHVLAAMGEDTTATAVVRCTAGRLTTEVEIDEVASRIVACALRATTGTPAVAGAITS